MNRRQAIQLQQQRQVHVHCHAFTLAELLIVIGVIAILLALAAPAIRQLRTQTTTLRCRSNVRQLGTLIATYASDFKGYYPTWITPLSPIAENPDFWRFYTQQYQRLFFRDAWLRYSNLPVTSPVYRCPANQIFRSSGKSSADYFGVAAFHADPRFLDPLLPYASWAARFGAAPQSLDNVRFPSAKAGLFEHDIWHGWRGALTPGSSANGLVFYNSPTPASMWFIDGHVEALPFTATRSPVDRSPVWYSQRVVLTADGIQGRDK